MQLRTLIGFVSVLACLFFQSIAKADSDSTDKISSVLNTWATSLENGNVEAVADLFVDNERLTLWDLKNREIIRDIKKFKEVATEDMQQRSNTKVTIESTDIDGGVDSSHATTKWLVSFVSQDQHIEGRLTGHHLLVKDELDNWHIEVAIWNFESLGE